MTDSGRLKKLFILLLKTNWTDDKEVDLIGPLEPYKLLEKQGEGDLKQWNKN